ncbi:MAG: hypothetical protein ACKPKO_26960, partial [Candidatus Fonsibacter sp.]
GVSTMAFNLSKSHAKYLMVGRLISSFSQKLNFIDSSGHLINSWADIIKHYFHKEEQVLKLMLLVEISKLQLLKLWEWKLCMKEMLITGHTSYCKGVAGFRSSLSSKFSHVCSCQLIGVLV